MHEQDHLYVLPPLEIPELEVLSCQLANGHDLKLEAAYWTVYPSIEEIMARVPVDLYLAIRVYSTENRYPRRLRWCEEFREGIDFDALFLLEIWDWLQDLVYSRAIYEFDDLDSFLDHVTEKMGQMPLGETLATDYYQLLPGLSAPSLFDRVDDSLFHENFYRHI